MDNEEQNFPNSQESMDIEEIGDSLSNLEIENKVREIKEHILENIERQGLSDNTAEKTQSTITEESSNENNLTQQSKTQQDEDFDYTGNLIGFTAKTLDEICEIYKKHAFAMGFESGLKPTEAYNLMTNEAGGEDLLGHTLRDHLNYISRRKMKEIEGGDAQTVIDNLYKRQAEEEDFFFRFKLGGDQNTNRLTTIYCRDSEMKEYFDIYGDVTVFDTTYRTNKYNLICAPIVGVNNHWQNVMFGCAFIADEKTDTFEWVLSTFKKSMGGSQPVTIFTDQDLAMSNAIEKVFPHSRHRLCIWHLIKNAVSRFGSLKRNTSFKDAFNKCLSGCITAEEFLEILKQSLVIQQDA
ncbi:protein FAR1-RELATED SEQUENCE 5-like [Chenopodium quinoa]|uniref:protein FAR1-RELATED SEQUENCE 5-like n=1 Tax=Chenopodium quinoa TaxID=63459 RepID=UPI000B794E75|nr:protein FAR1-RELATED SEQUENCE 5-like [Chenopodium quinoa]